MKQPNDKVFRLDDVYYDYEIDLETYDPLSEELDLRDTSFYAVEEDGCLYHYCGKNRIKVHEHFADHGIDISELIENVILHTAKTTAC